LSGRASLGLTSPAGGLGAHPLRGVGLLEREVSAADRVLAVDPRSAETLALQGSLRLLAACESAVSSRAAWAAPAEDSLRRAAALNLAQASAL
jgi:hypothetical protein